VPANKAAASDDDDAPEPLVARPLPPWLRPGTVRLVVSGLILVYVVGLLVDLRNFETVVVVEFGVMVVVLAVLLLTLRWWDATGQPPTKEHARVFIGLAGLLLLAILFLNTLG
jgi:hypothetical protein